MLAHKEGSKLHRSVKPLSTERDLLTFCPSYTSWHRSKATGKCNWLLQAPWLCTVLSAKNDDMLAPSSEMSSTASVRQPAGIIALATAAANQHPRVALSNCSDRDKTLFTEN